ncbi:methyltransferase domain protein [Clostridium sp. CAG:1024]|nr:methyltransferase domain protein [Clostridium sp. CAG:1024]
MQIERTVYESIYELLHSVVRHKTVPELAVGTGFSAKNIVNAAGAVESMDPSSEMIADVKRGNRPSKLRRARILRLMQIDPLMWHPYRAEAGESPC